MMLKGKFLVATVSITVMVFCLLVLVNVFKQKSTDYVFPRPHTAPVLIDLHEQDLDTSQPWFSPAEPLATSETKLLESQTNSSFWTKNVHLCVMFNLNRMKPNERVIKLLSSYYHPFFDHITFLFDGNWTEKPSYISDYVNFLGCDSYTGWYMQKCVKPSTGWSSWLFVYC